MPASTTNAKNFLFTADYPIEKVVLLRSGSLTMTAGTNSLSIPHDLPFTPLVGGVWSLDADFSTTYNLGAGPYPGTAGSPWMRVLEIGRAFSSCGVDSTNVTFGWLNLSSTVTVYYRIYGLEPDDSTATVSSTADESDHFTLNTDYNYQKLYMAGHLSNLTANGAFTVSHLLGWRPRVLLWGLTNTNLSFPIEFTRNDNIGFYGYKVTSSTTALTVTTDSFFDPSFGTHPTRIDYRIYIDEAGSV